MTRRWFSASIQERFEVSAVTGVVVLLTCRSAADASRFRLDYLESEALEMPTYLDDSVMVWEDSALGIALLLQTLVVLAVSGGQVLAAAGAPFWANQQRRSAAT